MPYLDVTAPATLPGPQWGVDLARYTREALDELGRRVCLAHIKTSEGRRALIGDQQEIARDYPIELHVAGGEVSFALDTADEAIGEICMCLAGLVDDVYGIAWSAPSWIPRPTPAAHLVERIAPARVVDPRRYKVEFSTPPPRQVSKAKAKAPKRATPVRVPDMSELSAQLVVATIEANATGSLMGGQPTGNGSPGRSSLWCSPQTNPWELINRARHRLLFEEMLEL